MADGYQLGRERLKRRLDLCQIKHRAPWRLHHLHIRAAALRDFVEQLAEAAEAADQHFVTGLDGREHDHLDGRAGGSVEHQRPVVLRLKKRAVQRHGFAHHAAELRVKLPQQLRGHGLEHPGVGVDGAGAHQQARGEMQFVHGAGGVWQGGEAGEVGAGHIKV